jgi:hypothetical protein
MSEYACAHEGMKANVQFCSPSFSFFGGSVFVLWMGYRSAGGRGLF